MDNLGIGILTKLYQNGYNTIKKICLITQEQLMELDGIKEKSASKIYNNIQKVISKSLPQKK